MARISIFIFLLPLAIVFAEAEKACPCYDHIADFSQPEEIKRIQDKVMHNLWSIETPTLTELAEELVDVLYDMFESRVPFWRRYALSVSELIWAYLPDIEKNLNLCSYAEMINKTLVFVNENDCKAILEAIDSSSKAFTEAGFRLLENSIRNAGCDCDISLAKPATTKCHKDGFEYDIEEMWEEIGWEYPWLLRKVVLELYKSCHKKDKMMALFATATLSKYLSILENDCDPETLYKTFIMFTPGHIPNCCCKQFIKEALDLSNLAQTKNVELFELARKATKCKCHSHA